MYTKKSPNVFLIFRSEKQLTLTIHPIVKFQSEKLLTLTMDPIVYISSFREAFAKDPELSNLLLDDFFRDAVHECQAAWRAVIAKSVEIG